MCAEYGSSFEGVISWAVGGTYLCFSLPLWQTRCRINYSRSTYPGKREELCYFNKKYFFCRRTYQSRLKPLGGASQMLSMLPGAWHLPKKHKKAYHMPPPHSFLCECEECVVGGMWFAFCFLFASAAKAVRWRDFLIYLQQKNMVHPVKEYF